MVSIFALFDDIAMLLDDIATQTKVAAGKVSGVVVDDIAVNSAVVNGIHQDREYPILLKIFAGSLANKVVLSAALVVLQMYWPTLVTLLLMVGALYLAYEGFHAIHEIWNRRVEHMVDNVSRTESQIVLGAIVTDIVLSLEILVIAMSSIKVEGMLNTYLTLLAIGAIVSVCIYGLVIFLVRLDNIGLWMIAHSNERVSSIGQGVITSIPTIIHTIAVIGAFAMTSVAGEILFHVDTEYILLNILLGTSIGYAVGALIDKSITYVEKVKTA